MTATALGRIDAVLLSHDHHFDNFDHAGRALVPKIEKVFTTEAGASRIGANAIGLANWQTVEFAAPDGRMLRISGMPAQRPACA